MESEGISLDQSILDEVGTKLSSLIMTLGKDIESAAGRPFNLNSPKQLGEILFGEMKLVEKPKKTSDDNSIISIASGDTTSAGNRK